MEKVSSKKIARNVTKVTGSDYHKVSLIVFEEDKMKINIDGKLYTFNLKNVSKKLLYANRKEREAYKIIASGYGISWPLIDEDLSIDGLLRHLI